MDTIVQVTAASEKDPNGNETKWTYDSTHDVEIITLPSGETTTIKRDSHGNPETISRPAPGEKTQVTKYHYDSHGDLESITDPLERTWKYEYDTHGDRIAEIDPETISALGNLMKTGRKPPQ